MDLGTVAAVISGLVLLPALYGRLKPVHRAKTTPTSTP
jgi:hypothetical protein